MTTLKVGVAEAAAPIHAPLGWRNARLRFVAGVNPGSGGAGLSSDEEVSFVPMVSVGEYGGLSLDQTKPLDEIGVGYTFFADGDIVVAKITPCFENGKGALANGLTDGVAFGTTELHVVRPSSEIDGRYLFYWTISKIFRDFGEGSMYGAGGQKRVPESFVKDFWLPLPSIQGQRSIADFLDRKTARIDALIAKKASLLDLLAEKRAAFITHAVTKGLDPAAPMKDSGVPWLGEIPTHWEVRPIRYVSGKVRTGGTPPSAGVDYFADEGVDWFTPGDFAIDPRLKSASRKLDPLAFDDGVVKLFPENSVLMVAIGATLGKIGKPPGVCCGNQQINAIECGDKMSADYLALFLTSHKPEVRMMSAASTLGIVNQERTKQIPCLLPPLKEQNEIAAQCFTAFDTEIMQARLIGEATERLTEYRSAVITAAVTGQIEVG